MRAAVVTILLILASCFGSQTSGIPLACSKEQPGCPSGLSCVDGVCTQAAPLDQGSGSVTDSAGTDQSTSYGCANAGGSQVGAAWACPGVFGAGGAAPRCAQGWRPCTAATGIDLTLCNSLGGFFVADVPGAWTNNYLAPLCRTTNDLEREVFFGCGKTGRYSFPADNACQGFGRSLECATTQSDWTCAVSGRGHTLADAANRNAADGILCCK